MKGDWCDAIDSVMEWNPDRGPGFPRLFFDSAVNIFRVLANMLDQSQLIQS